MTTKESPAPRLICIIEANTLVHAIVQNEKVVMGDLLQISKDSSLLHNPKLVIDSLNEWSKTKDFVDITFGLIHPTFTLYPTSSYSEENEKLWLSGYLNPDEGYTYFTNHINDNISNTFCIPRPFATKVRDHFPTAEFIHINSASIQQFDKRNETCVISHSINEYQLVNVFDDGHLICSNLYPCENEDAKLYYSLLPYQMFEFDRELVPIYINEVVKNNTILFGKLDTYLRHIHVNKLPDQADHKDSRNHNYLYPIYCISQCA